jgi:hypothetical protein
LRAIVPHYVVSLAMNCENSSGLLGDGSSPLATILLTNIRSVSGLIERCNNINGSKNNFLLALFFK